MAETPRVFLSYSHDSPEHKRWVADFASDLMENGIDVILDQWDLGLGDDAAKFMEKSVASADRVLMICTEKYVHKADDGKGGVGYEAMIVTGELVHNLGSSKFIPVIKQTAERRLRPKFMATRVYVDMSSGDKEQFELLLRELHQAPAVEKPALGKNPFARTPSGEELPTENPKPLELDEVSDPARTYATAIEIARTGEIIQWRELTRNARKTVGPGLASWRAKYSAAKVLSAKALVDQSLEGIREFAPLISIALAGIGSGRDKFSNQLSLLEEILYPKDWTLAGTSEVFELPIAAGFIYQSLHGTMCLYTDQVSQAIEMVRSCTEFPRQDKPIPIWRYHKIMGWPSSFGGNSARAWDVLLSLPEEYAWLNTIFGDDEDFLTALIAYYMALSINEYAYLLKDDQADWLKERDLVLNVPVLFLKTADDLQRRAYRLLLQDQAQVRNIWQSLEVTNEEFASHWDEWIAACLFPLTEYRGLRPFTRVIHANLPKDLGIV
jgi:TIR domain-containing protein